MEISKQKVSFQKKSILCLISLCVIVLYLAVKEIKESLGDTCDFGSCDCRAPLSFFGGGLKFMYRDG